MPFRTSLIVSVFIGLSFVTVTGAADAFSTLDRPVTIEVWGDGLEEVLQSLPAHAGVDVLSYPPDFASGESRPAVYLIAVETPLRAVLECLARRFSFRYRLSSAGRIEISRSYDWAATAPALRFLRLDAIVPPEGGDLAALRRMLAEMVKPLPLLAGEYSLSLEKSPTRENPNSVRNVVILPPVLADYLDRAVKCLSGDVGDSRAGTAPAGRNFASAWTGGADWESLLGRPVRIPAGGDLRSVLREVSGQTMAALMVHEPPTVTGPVQLPGAGGMVGLGRISEEIAQRYSLGRRVFLAAGAISFEPGSGMGNEESSHEMFWGGLAVAGFDAKTAVLHTGDSEALLARLRREVYPWLWRDPVCGLVYSPVSGRLAVVAPGNAVDAISGKLREIESEPLLPSK